MVLTGEVPADTLSRFSDSTDWIPLNRLPGFAEAPHPTPATPAASMPARTAAPVPFNSVAASGPAVTSGEEETLWTGHPSQILNFRVYFGWLLVLLMGGVGLYFAERVPDFATRVSPNTAWIAFGAIAFCALLHLSWAALTLRSTRYLVTTQRVRITLGLLGRDIQEIELFRVKDTAVTQSFLRRLLGVGDITIVSGDANNPNLHLAAIPGAIQLRERLRHEVLSLRQRFGVREVEMMSQAVPPPHDVAAAQSAGPIGPIS